MWRACAGALVQVSGFGARSLRVLATQNDSQQPITDPATPPLQHERYGGSLVGDEYKDPNVTMTHVYGTTNGAEWEQLLSLNTLDQYVLLMYVGFLGNLFDTLLKVGGLCTYIIYIIFGYVICMRVCVLCAADVRRVPGQPVRHAAQGGGFMYIYYIYYIWVCNMYACVCLVCC
jgi:hypothetical protein